MKLIFFIAALLALAAIPWVLFYLVWACWPAYRRQALRRVGFGAVTFVVAGFSGAIVDRAATTSDMKAAGVETREALMAFQAQRAEQEKAQALVERQEAERKAEEKRREDVAKAEQEKRDTAARKIQDYLDRLKQEATGLAKVDAKPFGESLVGIKLGLALAQSWAKLYEEGAELTLSPTQQATRQAFKSAAQRAQADLLASLRKAYGPLMAKTLWEADGKAKTFGAGYRSIEFVSGAFAANRNIKKIHDQVFDTLLLLRFTRAQYKWVNANVEYTYYTLEPPKDNELAVFNGASFRVLK